MISGNVLVIGAGGLGCGATLGLGTAGVTHVTVVDPDVVDQTNLHRQVLHDDTAVGEPKVTSIARALGRRFPRLRVTPIKGAFSVDTATELLAACDVVLDGSDNLATKFLANDAAVIGGKPLVHAAAVALGGQLVTVPIGGQPCFRCLFEELPAPDAEAPSCAESGVLGPVPGLLGALQAAEAVRHLRGQTPAFVGRLIRYDSRSLTTRILNFRRNPTCRVCGKNPNITSLTASAYVAEECHRP